MAVLAGDFMFAQSSWYLANLENIEVIKLISQVSSITIPLSLAFVKSLFQVLDALEASYLTEGMKRC